MLFRQKTKSFCLCFIKNRGFTKSFIKMGALEVKAMAFAEENGLKDVRFYKRWHKFDMQTIL